ncbi:hypothetical protein [Sphingomonas sp.]|uniref:hypothetical protein n=1 Tax=Sphingomonas sp. TaxID=28214 RepID=UPI0031DEEC92
MSRRRRTTVEDRERAYRALMNGIGVVEERIAPLWAKDRHGLSDRQRAVRSRVTANSFRELDVLLAHWIGMVAMRPVRMATIGDWREAPDAAGAPCPGFTPSEIRRLAADYRSAAPPPMIGVGCVLAA